MGHIWGKPATLLKYSNDVYVPVTSWQVHGSQNSFICIWNANSVNWYIERLSYKLWGLLVIVHQKNSWPLIECVMNSSAGFKKKDTSNWTAANSLSRYGLQDVTGNAAQLVLACTGYTLVTSHWLTKMLALRSQPPHLWALVHSWTRTKLLLDSGDQISVVINTPNLLEPSWSPQPVVNRKNGKGEMWALEVCTASTQTHSKKIFS